MRLGGGSVFYGFSQLLERSALTFFFQHFLLRPSGTPLFLFALLVFFFEHFRLFPFAQHFDFQQQTMVGGKAVCALLAVPLDAHNGSRWHMSQCHSDIRFVDFLTSRTAAACDVLLNIFRSHAEFLRKSQVSGRKRYGELHSIHYTFASFFVLQENDTSICNGGMAEWSKALASKASRPARVSRVRIPLPPPSIAQRAA